MNAAHTPEAPSPPPEPIAPEPAPVQPPEPTRASAAAPVAPRPGRFEPVLRWLSADVDLAYARGRRLVLDHAQRDRLRRAEEARIVADHLLDPLFSIPSGEHRWSAISLYRQSACLAVAALEPARVGEVVPALPEHPWPEPLAVAEFPVDEGLVAAGRRALVERDFYESSALDKKTLRREVQAARALVHRLLETLELRQRSPAQVLLQLAKRWLLVVLCVGALAALPFAIRKLRTPPGTIVSWRSSSAYAGFVAEGKRPQPQFQSLWFHTVEEVSPWVEVDLGFAQPIRGVMLKNRTDCCADRAIPLSIEVSTDRLDFREVARQEAPFDRITVLFPTVQARWVRLRAQKRTLLHLEDMAVVSDLPARR